MVLLLAGNGGASKVAPVFFRIMRSTEIRSSRDGRICTTVSVLHNRHRPDDMHNAHHDFLAPLRSNYRDRAARKPGLSETSRGLFAYRSELMCSSSGAGASENRTDGRSTRAPHTPRKSPTTAAAKKDGDGEPEPEPDLARLVNTLIERIAALSKPSIPIEHDLWSVTEIAAYFKRSESVVRERIVCVPSFPVAIRVPNERGQRMHALWPAADVIAWAHKHRERETA